MDQQQHNKYDPNVIIQAADDKLANSDLEGGTMIFQSALLDWTDDAIAGGAMSDLESLREAVATLWIAYAHFLIKAKQFKSATEAYEQAVSDQVAKHVGRVWLDYARFAQDRDKLKTAQDVYIRALVGGEKQEPPVTDEQDQNLLWQEFLEMMRRSNPDLTMEALQQAVMEREPATSQETSLGPDSVPSNVQPLAVSSTDISPATTVSPPAKRMRTEAETSIMTAGVPTKDDNKTHVVTAESVEVEATAFTEILQNNAALPSEVSAAWMIRDGNEAAQPPEPPLFEPAPPKLSDPTGKDLLGVDLALELIQRLLSPSGNVLLEVCFGLWTLQALKEKEAKEAIGMLDKTMTTENERMEANIAERLSVADNPTARAAVEQMANNERMTFQSICSQQRQNLLSGIAWEFRQLLCCQQQILTKLKVPGFVDNGPTVDAAALELQAKVCSYLHSAFYLRNRIGEEPHVSMLKSQVKRLEREQEQSGGAGSRSHSPHPYGGTTPPPQQQQQQQQMHVQPQAFHFLPPQQQPQQPPMMGMPMQSYGYQGQQQQQQQQQPPMQMPPPTNQQQQQPQQQPPGGYGAPPYPPYYHQ